MKNHQNRIKKHVKSSKYQLKTVSKAFKTDHFYTHIHGNKGIEHQKGNKTDQNSQNGKKKTKIMPKSSKNLQKS